MATPVKTQRRYDSSRRRAQAELTRREIIEVATRRFLGDGYATTTLSDIAREAGVTIARLNVGGGFPSHRLNEVMPRLEATFAAIDRAAEDAFGDARPALICEPGRGLVAEAFDERDAAVVERALEQLGAVERVVI